MRKEVWGLCLILFGVLVYLSAFTLFSSLLQQSEGFGIVIFAPFVILPILVGMALIPNIFGIVSFILAPAILGGLIRLLNLPSSSSYVIIVIEAFIILYVLVKGYIKIKKEK